MADANPAVKKVKDKVKGSPVKTNATVPKGKQKVGKTCMREDK